MASLTDRLKERKLVQWALAYLAGAWVLLEAIGFVSDSFGWPPIVVRSLILAVAVGLPVTLILAWYHGEQGRQRVSGPELLMLAAVLALGGGGLAVFAPDADSEPRRDSQGSGAIRTIAVLPFEDVSTTPDGAYLSTGLTASITDRLSDIDELRVAPRGVAATYGGPDVDLVAAGEALSVQALVTGSVGEVDGRLVVRAELTSLDPMSHVWGQQFDRPLTDILQVQDSLVRDIASQLRLQLTSEVDPTLTQRSTDNPEAFRLYLLSRFHNLSMSIEGWRRGRRYAEEAVRLDPGYALAWAGLSDSHILGVYLSQESPDEGYALARQSAETALALDESLAAGHMALGFVRHHADWDWEGARASFARAIELDPQSADALQGMSETLTSLGLTDEALEYAERAEAADPLTPVVSLWLGGAYSRLGRYEEALQALQRSLELEPDNLLSLFDIPGVLSQLGRHDEARANLEATLTRMNGDPYASPLMALLLAAQGRNEEARETMNRVDPERVSRTALARVWATLGEADLAFSLLEQAVERRETDLLSFKADSSFESLRSDARYDQILARLGLEP